ncbi:26S proteasome non-ATPase regulatory subunit 10-like isoform X2 [Periplaneta americana]
MAKPHAVHELSVRVKTLEEQVALLLPLVEEVRILRERLDTQSIPSLDREKFKGDRGLKEEIDILKNKLKMKERELQNKDEELRKMEAKRVQQEAEAEQRYQQIVKLFKSVPGKDFDRATAAARNGNAAAMQFLVDTQIDIEETDSNKKTLLQLASEAGHTDTVQVVLNAGAHVNAAKRDGASPLNLAAEGGHVEVCKVLLEARAHMKKRGVEKSLSALHCAARGGDVKVCYLLLANGAEVNAQDHDMWDTPLHMAARKGHILVVRFLLDHGADINMKNYSGKTPADCARSENQTEIIDILTPAVQFQSSVVTYRE